MNTLAQKKCVACEGGIRPLAPKEYTPLLKQVLGWKVVNLKFLEREFSFRDFKTALRFVNHVGKLAEREGHHPNIFVHGWNKVRLTLFTHAIGGLSENDFIMAAKVNSTNSPVRSYKR